MSDTRKKVEGEYLQYQGKPLVREEDTIIYGDLNHDPYVLVLEIMSYKEENGERIPDKILVQILDSKDPNKVIKNTQKIGIHDAFTLGVTWLDMELKKSAKD